MDELLSTIEWVGSTDLSSVAGAVGAGARSSLVAVGSGGSLSAANHLSRLHRAYFGETATALTPYNLCSSPIALLPHHWIFSAGGSNADVVAATRACILGEAHTTNIVTMKPKSKVAELASGNPRFQLHVVQPPSKKDGFLATNSLLAFCGLMSRAYLHTVNRNDEWDETEVVLKSRLSDGDANRENWRAAARKVAAVDSLLVLHDSGTSLGAFDLESKLTEAGIKNVQLADYRHFAHGRHHWLAKNPANSGVLAFASSDRSLAERTIRLLPSEIPTAKIQIDGSQESTQLSSLLAAFFVTEELSFEKDIDPGQPGVPEFGRKIYNLRSALGRKATPAEIAISRKLALPRGQEVPHSWRNIYSTVIAKLNETEYGGLVLDYDGTIVDTRDRFSPPATKIVSELVRLLDSGLCLGIATGRGKSAGAALRAAIPAYLWPQVIVGYYNGAELASLGDQESPNLKSPPLDLLLKLQDKIEKANMGRDDVITSLRPQQLTVSSKGFVRENYLWSMVSELIEVSKFTGLTVLRSSHSVDVLAPGVSKLSVVRKIASITNAEILRIGDRGQWPGNDHELLASPFGLSVDQVSGDPYTCWNIAPQGMRGTQVTRYLLDALSVTGGTLRAELGTA